MNIGSVARRDGGYIGKIATLALDAAIAFVPVQATSERSPRFEVLARNNAKRWVRIGALWEQTAKDDGACYLTGKLDDPSMAQPLYIAAFEQQDGSYNIVWNRPVSQAGSRQRGETSPFGDTPQDNAFAGSGPQDDPFAAGDITLNLSREPAGGSSGKGKGRAKTPSLGDDLNDDQPF